MKYGYARISRKTQSIERQITNIKAVSSDAILFTEAYTGTKIDRPEWKKLCKVIKPGDEIIFDSVSRMSRNAEEGIKEYMNLYNKGIKLTFIKEPHINSEVYRESVNNTIASVGNEIADCYIEATNKVLMILANRQIEIAFEQAQKEVDDLHQRTKEGMREAGALNECDEEGNIIRQGSISQALTGKQYKVKKADTAKEIIKKHSKSFGGSLSDSECMELAKLSHCTYYKYKKELMAEEA